MQMFNLKGLARTCLMLASVCVVAAMASCGGSPLPAGFTGGGGTPPPSVNEPTKSFTVTPTVSGFGGGSGSAATEGRSRSITTRGLAELRGEPESFRAIQLGGSTVKKGATKAGVGDLFRGSGSNGNDLVDLSGNNLFVSGLSNTSLAATITFKAQGSGTSLGSITLLGNQVTNNSVTLSGTALGAGQNLLVEVAVNALSSTAVVPSTFFQNGGGYGFNIVRRPDGSLIIELFPDSIAPIGSSDNGSRIVIDTAVDALKNNNYVTIARFETPDGLVLFDSNLDGLFGSAQDAVILIDTNRDGLIDNKDTPVSYAVDPNLDGVSAPNESRLLGNNVPEDFINSVVLTTTPDEVVGNGLSVISLKTRIEPAFNGNPIGSSLTYTIARVSGDLAQNVQGGAEARFAANGQLQLLRTIDPLAASVRVLTGGVVEITDAIRAPVLDTDGVYTITLSYKTSTSNDPREIPVTVNIKRNTAPTLTNVLATGTVRKTTSSTGLTDVSTDIRVVEGNAVEVHGTNFALDPASIRLTFGGVTAVVEGVSPDGKTIFSSVPAGAITGPVAVIQGTVGANTSEDFVVQGQPILVESFQPANNSTSRPTDGIITVRFNQPMNSATFATGIVIRAGGNSLNGTNWSVSADLRTATYTPLVGSPFAPNTLHEVVLTPELRAENGVAWVMDAKVGFVDPNAVPAPPVQEAVVISFTTGASAGQDSTPPAFAGTPVLVSPSPATGGRWALDLVFSEGLNPGSITLTPGGAATDGLVLSRGDGTAFATADKIGITLTFSGSEGQNVRAFLEQAPLGRETYTVTLNTGAKDLAGNSNANPLHGTFTTPLRIDGMSKISGPAGSQVVIEGSTFDSVASNLTVEFTGPTGPLSATIIDASQVDVTVEVPAGAIDGPVTLAVAAQTATAPRNFTVTSAGFVPRVIATGAGAFGLAVDFNDVALVSFQDAGEMALIDLSTEQPIDANPATSAIDRMTVGGVPTAARLDATGKIGFTTNYGSVATAGSTVFVIDMVSRSLKAAIPVGERPARIAISPDNRRAYVTNFQSDSVSVIDIESLSVEATIPVGLGPNGIVISPDNARGYVCNFLDGTVTVFEVNSLLPIATIPVGENPARVLLSADSRNLFVTNFGANSVSVIDALTQAPVQTLTGVTGPTSMVFGPGERNLWVVGRLQNIIQEFVKTEAGLWVTGERRIAVGDLPSTVNISIDGALLVYACEGSGEVGVVTVGDPQPVISGFEIKKNDSDASGTPTFSVDRRQTLWIRGRGFGSANPSELEVKLGNTVLPIVANSFNTRKLFKVDIPAEASSGTVVVTRTLSATDVRSSNPLALLVTRKNPSVVSVNPGDGSSGVAIDTRIVIDFSEPLDPASVFGSLATSGSSTAVRVNRRSDDGSGSDSPVSGIWRLTSQGFRLEFTPSGTEPFRVLGSNNIYEVAVTTGVKDLFGNGIVGSATTFASSTDSSVGATSTSGVLAASLGFRSRFQTADLLGPRLVEAVYRDLDNNGVGPGDQLELRFDENLRYYQNNFDITFGLALTALSGNPGTLGTGVQATLGRTPRHLLVTLGLGANFVIANGAAVNIVNNVILEISDFVGNPPVARSSAVPISLDPASDNLDNPNLLAVYVIDTDSSNSVTAGDELRLTFNEPTFRGSVANPPSPATPPSPSTFVRLTNGTLGSSTFISRGPGDDFRTLRILLAGNAAITTSGANQTLVELVENPATVVPGQLPTMAAATFNDLVGNPAYAGSPSSRRVTLGLPPPSAMLSDAGTPARFFDLVNTPLGLSEGDAVVIPFTGPVFFNPLAGGGNTRPADIFDLGVLGDRFGAGARITQPAFITYRTGATTTDIRPILPNELVIILGTEPVMTFEGAFGSTGAPATEGRGK